MHGDLLDWDWIVETTRGSWAATAVHVMLSYLAATDLAAVPPEVLRRFAVIDRHANWISVRLLHRVITAYVVEGRPFGPALSEYNVGLIWSAVMGQRAPVVNLLSVPYHLACPPRHPDRFRPRFAIRRLGSFLLARGGNAELPSHRQ